jgi:glycosyltransferase involved in cell wall biosynthesis
MTEAQPRISVVTAVYNGAEYVEACVASVLAQTTTDFEFILADDGSTDSTLEALKLAAIKDSRIRVLSLEHQGKIGTVNAAVESVLGEFIALIDVDDLMLPNRLADQLALFERDSRLGVVGGAYRREDRISGTDEIVRPPTDDLALQKRLCRCVPFAVSVATVRTRAWREVGGFKSPDCDDCYLWLELVKNGWRIGATESVIGEHFVYATSQFYSAKSSRFRQLLQARFHFKAVRELSVSRWYIGYPLTRYAMAYAPSSLNKWARRSIRANT